MLDFIEKNKSDDEDHKSEHTGSVSLSDGEPEDEGFTYLERDLDVKVEMNNLLDYSVISKIFCLLHSNNNSSITIKLNELKRDNILKFIVKIFERITNNLKSDWIFYQYEYLYIINQFMNDKFFLNDPNFAPLKNVFSIIIKNYFVTLRKNKLLALESLFRVPSAIIKDQILNNYETVIVESREEEYKPEEQELFEKEERSSVEGKDCEYDSNMFFEILDSNKKKNKKLKKAEKIEEEEKYYKSPEKRKLNLEESVEDVVVWTENEDLILIKNYIEFKDFDNLYDILEKLFPSKNKREIKHRIKTLKLKKGEKKAMKMLKKIHKKKNKKREKEQLFNIIIELSDDCKNEVQKHKIEKTIISLKEQLESFKVKKGLLDNSPELECVLIPTSNEEIDMMNDSKFKNFIKNLGLLPPDNAEDSEVEDGEGDNTCIGKYWKVNPKNDSTDLGIIIEKLDNFMGVINENVEVEDPERDRERDKDRERVRDRKKEKKKDKKKKKHKNSEDEDIDNIIEAIKYTDNKSIAESEAVYENNFFANDSHTMSHAEKSIAGSVAKSRNTFYEKSVNEYESEKKDTSKKRKKLRKGLREEEDNLDGY